MIARLGDVGRLVISLIDAVAVAVAEMEGWMREYAATMIVKAGIRGWK